MDAQTDEARSPDATTEDRMIVIKLSSAKYLRLMHLCAWTWGPDACESDVNPSEYMRGAASSLVRLS